MTDSLRPRFTKAVECMDIAEEDTLAFMAFSKAHWPKPATTNGLERLNKGIKRRAKVVGIFPNSAAVPRLAGAVLLEQNDEWPVRRRGREMRVPGPPLFIVEKA